MGLTGAGLNAFRARVDEVLRDVFPAVLVINGNPKQITASGPGGKAVSSFIDYGEQTEFRFPFRVPRAELVEPLRTGMSIDWIVSAERTLKLEVAELSERPHEDSVSFSCKKRREA